MGNKLYYVEERRRYFVYTSVDMRHHDAPSWLVTAVRDLRLDTEAVLVSPENYAQLRDDAGWNDESCPYSQFHDLGLHATAQQSFRTIRDETPLELGTYVETTLDTARGYVTHIDAENDAYTWVHNITGHEVTSPRAGLRYLEPGFRPGARVMLGGLTGKVEECLPRYVRVTWHGTHLPLELRTTLHPYADLGLFVG